MIRIIQGGHFNRPVSRSRLFSFRPFSSYSAVPSFRKPSSRFVMYTTSCCSGSSVPNVDPLPSLSQLNSSIEIFSRLPVFSVGSTCSSSCFCFSVVLTSHLLWFLAMFFFCQTLCGLPTHHCGFDIILFSCGFVPYGL